MKKIMIKVFRDIPSSVLLMMGFCLTIFITMVCCGLVNNILNSKQNTIDESITCYYLNMYHTERVIEEYESGFLSHVEDSAEKIRFDFIYDVMKKNSVNFYGTSQVHIGAGQEQQRLATVIYAFDETIPFKIKSGFVDWEGQEHTVVIGESIIPFVTKLNNEDYLYVDGEYFKVTGVAVNDGSGGYDSSIYFINGQNADNVPQNMINEIISDIMFGLVTEITAYSNNFEIVNHIRTVKSELENNHSLHIDIESESSKGITENEAMNFLYEMLNKVFMPVLFIFSLGSCYSITSLWVKVRRTDIAIRITHGFGRFQMYKWMMKEISILLGISIVVSVAMRIFYLALFGELSTLTDNTIYDILIIGGAMCITLLITSLGAYRYSKSIIPAAALKEL